MNVRLGGRTSQASSRPPWALLAGSLALGVVLGVWAVPDLATPLSTAAAVLGGFVTVYKAGQGKEQRSSRSNAADESEDQLRVVEAATPGLASNSDQLSG